MTKRMLATLSVLLVLSACGSGQKTWYNPFGWFGGSEETESLVQDVGTPQDPRPLVDQVLALSVEPFDGGAIIRATGLPQTQGYWAAELIAEPVVDGRANFRFVVVPPVEPMRVSTQPSREIMVATTLTNRELESISEITVTGARNARSSRR